MPFAEGCAGWPDADDCASISIVRFLTLAKCFGPERSLRALGDSLLQELMLLPAGFRAESVAAWCERIEPRHLEQFKRAMLAWATDRGLRRELSRSDVVYSRLERSSRVRRTVDRKLSVAALLALRSLAKRLAGFADSSPTYLRDGFLCFSANLENEPQRRVVRLGRAPLNVVLAMSGLVRGEYRLRWLGDRPFALFQEA
jgi:hypothetical protein